MPVDERCRISVKLTISKPLKELNSKRGCERSLSWKEGVCCCSRYGLKIECLMIVEYWKSCMVLCSIRCVEGVTVACTSEIGTT